MLMRAHKNKMKYQHGKQFRRKFFYKSSLLIIALGLLAGIFSLTSKTNANQYDKTRLMDDAIFTDTSWSVSDIQNWLNQNAGFIKDWHDDLVVPFPNKWDYGGNVCYVHTPTHMSAAQIIYQAATNWQSQQVVWRDVNGNVISPGQWATYSGTIKSCQETTYWQPYGLHTISPKVMLTTLQKEQTLITAGGTYSSDPNDYLDPSCGWNGSECTNNQYKLSWAAGYGVPDSLVFNHRFKGFYNQVNWAMWQLRFNMERSAASPNSNCGATNLDPSQVGLCYDDSEGLTYGGPMTAGTYVRSSFASPTTYTKYWSIDGNGNWYQDTASNAQFTINTRATASLYYYTPHACDSGCGNYNFDMIYEQWFGAVWVPQYSWSLQSVSYSTGTNSFGAGEPGTVTVKVVNQGSVPWYNYGDYPVRLGTWQIGRSSPLYSPGWLSPTRPANMTETQVDPGGVATFTFPINVNNVGTYIEGLNLVVENSQWMPWQGLSPTINIKPRFQWKVNSVTYGNGTGLMVPGTDQQITVTAQNTGFDTWSKTSGPPVRLATWQPDRVSAVVENNGPKNWISSTRVTDMNEDSVAPGGTANFQFYVHIPKSGNFYERLNLVAEGEAWFNDPGLTLYLRGGAYAWKPLWSAYSTGGDANLARGTTLTITVKAQNTGEVAWTNISSASNPWVIKLATTDPQDRGSFLYDSSWLGDTRPAALQESVVQPGQNGTFIFKANIPNNTYLGAHYEYLSLVAEGMTWFNNPNFNLYFNVK